MTDNLLLAKQHTLAWVHGEYKFPETPKDSMYMPIGFNSYGTTRRIRSYIMTQATKKLLSIAKKKYWKRWHNKKAQ